MPRWMYGLLGLALAWLVWTNLLKPAPNVSQITTQQGVQVMALESSLSREDTGNGACELMRVDSIIWQ